MKRIIERIKGLLLCLSFLFLTIAACPAYCEFINIGVILPLSGKLESLGENEKQSFLMALDEINAAGGVKGIKLRLIIEDTGGEVEKGRQAMKKLIEQDRVIAVTGGFSSTVSWAASEEAQQSGIPFLVSTASADRITEKGWDYVFRLSQPSSERFDILSSFISKTAPVKTAAIIFERSVGRYGADNFLRLCRKMGIDVVIKEYYTGDTVDLERFLRRVETEKPDLAYLIPDEKNISIFMQNIRSLAIKPKLILLHSGSLKLHTMEQGSEGFIEHICTTSLWPPSLPYPGAREFYNRFLSAYGSHADYHAAQAYASMYVIYDALKRADVLTPEYIRDALSLTDTMTVYGPVRFISYGRKNQQNRLPVFLLQWINGRFETVWPEELATSRYVYPMPGM